MDIAVSYHDTVTKLQGLDLSASSPFDRLEWYALLEHPLFAMAERSDDRVVVPLQRHPNGLSSLTNWFSFTWRPIGKSSELIHELARDLRSRTHRVTLTPLPNEDGTAEQLEQTFRDAGWFVLRDQCDENHVLPVAGRTFAEYWAGRPGKMRTTLKRKAKKVDVDILTHFDETAWAAYKAIYSESWKKSGPIFSKLSQRRKAQPVASGWASRARTACPLPRSSGRSKTALPIFTSSRTLKPRHPYRPARRSVPLYSNMSSIPTGSNWSISGRAAMPTNATGWSRCDPASGSPASTGANCEPGLPSPRRLYATLHRTIAPAKAFASSGRPTTGKAEAMIAETAQAEPTGPSRSDIDQTLRAILRDVLGLDQDQVDSFTGETGLFGHLPELDSMAVAGLLTEMEDRLDIVIEDDDVDGEMLENFGGLLAFAEAKVIEG